MINDLDETIRQVLLNAGQLDPNQVDISFDLPNRDWAARISKPTVNCYLFDLRENLDLREQGWNVARVNGDAARRQPALRFNLTYLVTAWTREVEDEHRLLWHTLQTLVRFPVIPAEYLKGSLLSASEAGFTVSTTAAKPGGVLASPGEFWTALENHLKPSLSYVVTLPLDREAVIAGPPVFTSRLRTARKDAPETPAEERGTFGGVVRDSAGQPLSGATIFVEGQAAVAVSDGEGRFRLPDPQPGRHTLVAQFAGGLNRREIDVPQADYDIDIHFGGG